jgi:hypothetical protein
MTERVASFWWVAVAIGGRTGLIDSVLRVLPHRSACLGVATVHLAVSI